jgi:probable addiction module antidote protein
MTEKFFPYDTARVLGTEADIATYMDAAVEEAGEDAAFVVHALGVVARARNMSELARQTGMSREGLYKAFSGQGNPSFATVMKVARALGVRLSAQPVAA